MDEEQIFARALGLPADKRAGFLDAIYHDRPKDRAKMEAMLAAHQQTDSLLDEGQIPSTSGHMADRQPSEQIGPYKLLQKLGEGGMGAVYMAEQEKPVQRVVALKLIKAGLDSKQVVARFEAERQSLAMMDHPNIAKVLDAGTTDRGEPYFVMELVKGVPISEYCDENRLSTSERIDLMVDVCLAVQHAHQKGIIHRDLKPSNILVAQYDDRPVPKVIDFGVAKATHQKLTEKTLYTQLGQIVGTLEYMSPEQAVLNQLDVDTRTDVYSLGVILYELLVGVTPLDSKSLRQQGLDQILRTIREEEPPRPSLRLSSQGPAATQTATYRKTDQAALSRSLRGELDWVVMKALEKDRSRRYDSASRLAEDLNNYLDGNTVDARPPTIAYRIHKSWKRNRTLLSGTGAIVLILTVGIVGMWIQNARLRAVIQSWREDLISTGLEAAFRGDVEAIDDLIGGQSARDAELPMHWSLLMQGLATHFGGDTIAAQGIYEDALDYAPESIAIRSARSMSLISRKIDQMEWQTLVLDLVSDEIPDGPYQEFDELLFGWSQVYVDPHRSAALLRRAVRRPSPISGAMLAQALGHKALDNTNEVERKALAREAYELIRRSEKRAGENPFVMSIGLFIRSAMYQIVGPESISREDADEIAGFLAATPNLWQGKNILSHYYALVDHPDALEQFRESLDEDWAGACAAAYLWEHGQDVPLPNFSTERPFPQPYAMIAEACIDVTDNPSHAMPHFRAAREQFYSLKAKTYALEILLHAGELDKARTEARKLLGTLTEYEAPIADGPFFCNRKRLQIIAGKMPERTFNSNLAQSKTFQCYAHYLQGLIARAEGDQESARSHFRATVDSGQFYIPQYYMARALLSRM